MCEFECVLLRVLQQSSINTALICRKPQKSWLPRNRVGPLTLLSTNTHLLSGPEDSDHNRHPILILKFGNQYTDRCRSGPWEQSFQVWLYKYGNSILLWETPQWRGGAMKDCKNTFEKILYRKRCVHVLFRTPRINATEKNTNSGG